MALQLPRKQTLAQLSGASGKFAHLASTVNTEALCRKLPTVSAAILPDAPLRDRFITSQVGAELAFQL